MIYGNTEGIRDSELARLESLYDFEIEPDCFAPRELLEVMASFTGMIGRELSVYLSRSGEVLDVSVGNQNSVGLRNIRLRRSASRLSKVRCIHTHPNGDAHLSEVDLSSLKSMYFDSMASVGVLDGTITGVQASFLTLTESGELGVVLTKVVEAHAIPQRAWMERIEETDRGSLIPARNASTTDERERAVLVSIEEEQSIEELAALAETAGAVVVGKVIQKKKRARIPPPLSVGGRRMNFPCLHRPKKRTWSSLMMNSAVFSSGTSSRFSREPGCWTGRP